MLKNLGRALVEARRLWSLLRKKPRKFIGRAVGFIRAKQQFRGATLGPRVCATGDVTVVVRGELRIGGGVTFVGGMIPTRLAVWPGAELVVGNETIFNYAGSVEARRSIRIGRRCMFASHVRIADALNGVEAPIVIGDDVWVAHGATLHPGVTVGDGSVIAAGSVVTRDVPPGCLAVGNPARSMALR